MAFSLQSLPLDLGVSVCSDIPPAYYTIVLNVDLRSFLELKSWLNFHPNGVHKVWLFKHRTIISRIWVSEFEEAKLNKLE